MDIKIRKPESKDRDEIFNLFETVLKDTYIRNDIWQLQEDFVEELEEKKQNLSNPEHHFLIAETTNRIVGCIEYTLCNDLINELTDNVFAGTYEIGTVYVHPDYQRQGIASIMLDKIMIEMLNNDIREFCLDCGFPTAQLIWTKKFGEPRFRFKDHWGKDSDHCIWVLRISESLKK